MDRVATTSAERHASRKRAVCVGADVGGTWIRIAVWSTRRVAPTIVPAHRDLQQLASMLRAVWRRRRWSRRSVSALVVASRGLWTPAERRILARALSGLAARVHVISDAQAALLGALGRKPGVLLLSGTGSIVVGRTARGRWARAGGLGPILARPRVASRARARRPPASGASRLPRPRTGEDDGRTGPPRARAGASRRSPRAAHRGRGSAPAGDGRLRSGAGTRPGPHGERELGGERAGRRVVPRGAGPRGGARRTAGQLASSARAARRRRRTAGRGAGPGVRPRRLVITVCPREPGVVVLPITRGGRAVRLDAEAIRRHLEELVAERGLGDRVRLREGCAGGCSGPGPNVSIEMF